MADKPRRAYGSGSVYMRADGRWVGVLRLGRGADGTPQRRAVYGATRREAQEKLAALRRQAATGPAVLGSRETVRSFVTRWLADRVELAHPPKTVRQYRGHLDRYLLPALGTKRLGDVTASDLQALYGELSRQGLAPATVRLTHAVAHALFEEAIQKDLIGRNPADRAHPPAKARTVRPTLTAAQAQYLLRSVRGDALEALWWLLLTAGLRIGEALALEWRSVDLGRATLSVRDAKTPRGRRLIPLCGPLAKRLHAQYQAAQDGPTAPRYVLANPQGGPWSDSTVRAHRWYPLRARLGLPPVRLHDLRHSVATLLLELGVHPKVVAEILGHSGTTITMDTYSHVAESMGREALDRLGALLDAEGVGVVEGSEGGEADR